MACFMRDRYAQYLTGKKILKDIQESAAKNISIPGRQIPFPFLGPQHGPLNLPDPPGGKYGFIPPDVKLDFRPHVCIVGAGMSGLFLAMLLDSLNDYLQSDKPLFTYEIFDASDRPGGRVYTKVFNTDPWHDYYDVGAMRFPNIPIMDRTFKLFKQVGVTEETGLLIPYILDGENCPQRYNDIVHVPSQSIGEEDPYHFSVANQGTVPNSTIEAGADKILNDAFGEFKESMKENEEKGFQELLEWDGFTTRGYLRQRIGYDFQSIQYLETTNSASGLYDQAFTESVMDSFDFDYPTDDHEPVKWFCVRGGTSVVVDRMVEKIKQKPSLNSRVASILFDQTDQEKPMEVKIVSDMADEKTTETKNFSAVFNTATLSCMQRMDLRNAGLSRYQMDAMRCLHYDSSTKVAIEFRHPWWITECNIKGGSASTDLPIRTCVYPSYNLDATGTAVLLCSYTWAQDALRIGSLASCPSPGGATAVKDSQLKDLLIHNLALLHQEPASRHSYDDMYALIEREYHSHHAYNWSDDPNTSGAFALYGPGQFQGYYPELIMPAAGGHMFLAGEACSTHHAWIVRALDSAYRALYQYLCTLPSPADKLRKFLEQEWGILKETPPDASQWHAILTKVYQDSDKIQMR